MAPGVWWSRPHSRARSEKPGCDIREGSVRAAGRVSVCVIPPVETAALIYEGSHSNVDMTYGALATYVAQHVLPLQGPIREYYLSGPQDTPDETAWRTEIAWPIFHTG